MAWQTRESTQQVEGLAGKPAKVTSWAALDLRQSRFGLGEPEGHVHRPVQRHGRPKRRAGLLSLSRGGIQQAKAAVAVGLEWAHAECFGQGQGLLVVDGSVFDLWGIATRGNLA